MVQRFLFDRINRETARETIRGGDQLVAHAPPDIALAMLPVVQAAVAWAEVALDFSVVPQMPVFRRSHGGRITLFFLKVSFNLRP